MRERTAVRLPGEPLARAKRKAAAEGRTVTSLIEEGLRLVTGEDRKAAHAARVLPPTSTAKGGLRPDVDLTRFSDIQGMDDLDSMERSKRFE
jgi:hypothetical protein